MNHKPIWMSTVLASAALLLAACGSDGDFAPGGSGPVSGIPGLAPDLPNLNAFPTLPVAGTLLDADGSNLAGRFVCRTSLQADRGATTSIGTGGLVGGTLSGLLNLLGARPVTALLNSVKDPERAIDGDLSTASTFTLPVGLLGPAISNVEQNFFTAQGTTVPAGGFAAVAVGFPNGTLDLTLLGSITVTTFRSDVPVNTVAIAPSALDLAGANVVGPAFAFIGLKASGAYDRVTLRLAPQLSVNLGEALKIYEVCTDVRIERD